MSPLNKMLVITFGAVLSLAGLYLLFRGGVTLPTRSPPIRFHFSGLSRILLGLSPLVLGGTCVALALEAVASQSRVVRWLIGGAIASLGFAFLLASKS